MNICAIQDQEIPCNVFWGEGRLIEEDITARLRWQPLQEGLLKKDKKAASFVTIGEPDIEMSPFEGGSEESPEGNNLYQLEVQGIDIYDPIKNQIKPRNAKDIAYWSVDDNYDGSNFVVRQIFFSGGDQDEFKDIKKELKQQAKQATKKKWSIPSALKSMMKPLTGCTG